ncbi:MAG: hypothetical protein ACT4P7_05810 [Gemmatimonadaceae bacterium]
MQRASQRPVLDGKLDDPVWQQARPLTRFVPYEPVDSVLPPRQSVGWVSRRSSSASTWCGTMARPALGARSRRVATPRIDVTFKHRAGINVSYMIERQDMLGVPLHQLTRRLGPRLIGEYSNQLNRLESNPVDQRRVSYASSLLLTYELAPSSFLFARYNDLMQEYDHPVVDRPETLRTGSQVFLKLSYLFRM